MTKTVFFRVWVIVVVVSGIFSLLIYATVQQVLRQGANDPQIQVAEDIVIALENGAKVTDFNSNVKTDIAKSLGTYVVIYDPNGAALTGTGLLNGTLPSLPKGVFDSAKSNGEDKITWQPESNVRSAIVVVPYSNGFVMAGRSLREIEKREDKTFNIAVWGWLFSALLSLSFVYFFEKHRKK